MGHLQTGPVGWILGILINLKIKIPQYLRYFFDVFCLSGLVAGQQVRSI